MSRRKSTDLDFIHMRLGILMSQTVLAALAQVRAQGLHMASVFEQQPCSSLSYSFATQVRNCGNAYVHKGSIKREAKIIIRTKTQYNIITRF